MMNKLSNIEDDSIVVFFNERNAASWGKVYQMLYVELVFFAKRLYFNTNIEPRDVVQDIFVKMWEAKSLQFKSISNIKAYMYIAVKNSFLDHIIHNKSVDKFKNEQKRNSDYFVTEIVETETLLALRNASNMLPADVANVFRMLLEGYEVKEIAEKLNKPLSTIYTQKQNAIDLLKRKLPPEKIFILIIISGL